MRARDNMTRSALSAGPADSVHYAVRRMPGNRASGRPVLDDSQRLLGILNDGDMVQRREPDRMELGRCGLDAEPTPVLRSLSWRIGDGIPA